MTAERHTPLKAEGEPFKSEGAIIIISAPSGAGKTTLCRRMLEHFPDMRASVSFTTRMPRAGEEHGRDYLYISRDEFVRMRDNGHFAEWAEVHGDLYGTPLQPLADAALNGTCLLLDIDCQGALQLKKRFSHACSVFILPPSMEELKKRLQMRGSDAEDRVKNRLIRAGEEIRQAGCYDYIVVNDILEQAEETLAAIIKVQQTRSCRMLPLVARLLATPR